MRQSNAINRTRATPVRRTIAPGSSLCGTRNRPSPVVPKNRWPTAQRVSDTTEATKEMCMTETTACGLSGLT